MSALRKYPRTPHLEGSRPQPGDEELETRSFASLAGRHVVVEEKVDGANAGISFDADGRLQLQSRGHFLEGGARERHFGLFKTWAACHQHGLREALDRRYILYGEWLYAKHTLFYDQLPHYFLEFDVLDTERDVFLATAARRDLLAGLPLVSVPVLWEGEVSTPETLHALLGPSHMRSPNWRAVLHRLCESEGLDAARVDQETDPSPRMEGLYVKVEEDGRVIERYKLVRPTFATRVLDSESHWLSRAIIPNQLREGVDLFGDTP